jgi:chorismate synthase
LEQAVSLHFTTSGESHGPALVAILEGLPAGLPLAPEIIDQDLERRQQGYGAGPRMKIEQDHVRILGGVMDGKTIGSPLAMVIENRDHTKWGGQATAPMTVPRPGHADLTGTLKYGYPDLRPALERASARETAARVAVGAACRQLLNQFGILVGGYVQAIGGVTASLDDIPLSERCHRARQSEVGCPDEQAGLLMKTRIRQAMQERDTLGGVIEAVVLGLPPGLGSYVHWERRLEARLGEAVLSIPAIKGVEIGPAFENATRPGTQAHDAILLEDGLIKRPSNRAGGLEGGVTNGEPVLVRAAMKPIATTLSPQMSVDLASGEQAPTRYERSDFCPVPRAVVIVEAMLAFVVADALLEKLGGDQLEELLNRFHELPQARLQDIHLDNREHEWWPE